MLATSLLVIIASFFIVMGVGIFNNNGVDDEMLEPVSVESGKVNVLICGVDKSESLTDTIMVASYNIDTNEVNILSIPRDTRMYIGSKYQKINSAFSVSQNGKKKGMNSTIEAVTRLTGIPINYYVKFTFDAFRETIDALGGVYFDVPQNMNYDDPVQDLHIHLKKGEQLLDGDKAEQFVRFRRYPMGDIDRVAAQQNFMKALFEQKMNASIIAKIPELYKTLQDNLDTNITVKDVARYMSVVTNLSAENIHMHALPGIANGTDYGSSYWIADMTQLKTLIEDTFGYPADNITIHSKDGSSAAKDKKNTVSETKKPEATKTPTKKPTATKTPEPEKTPAVTKKPKTTQVPEETPKESGKPASTQKPTKAPDNITQDAEKETNSAENTGNDEE